jgi:hypothetical protein
MIDIGTTSFLINVQSLSEEDFERYSSNLFDEWEKSIEQTLILPDYSISLEIEEGSINGKGKIAIALGALYLGIGNYGDFISGLETIRDQASYVGNALFERAKSPFGCSSVNAKVRRNGGALSLIHRLFEKVQRGVLTADEAMLQVRTMLGEEGESVPEFIRELQHQLETVPRYPEQLSLIDEEWEECTEKPPDGKKPKPQKPRPEPTPIPQHYRVEIWRASKKDKKRIKVTKL